MSFALLTIWLAIAASDAAAPQRYSADWEISAQGALSQTWHVQVDGGRIRADLTAWELVGLRLYACPQRGIVPSWACGTSSASRFRSEGGVNKSLSPRVASTGQLMPRHWPKS